MMTVSYRSIVVVLNRLSRSKILTKIVAIDLMINAIAIIMINITIILKNIMIIMNHMTNRINNLILNR